MVLEERAYFLPVLLPENNENRVIDYFSSLADALTQYHRKLATELPQWASEFSFEQERTLQNERESLLRKMQRIDDALDTFTTYKRALCTDGDNLVKTVESIFRDGFEYKVDATDEYKEDLKILDEQGKPIVFIEVKGTSRGVQREYINQADNHRERADFSREFPTILIINTLVNKAHSLGEKDHEVNTEQVRHAYVNNVLVIRTIDLLTLLDYYQQDIISKQEVSEILTRKKGWLKFLNESVEIFDGVKGDTLYCRHDNTA